MVVPGDDKDAPMRRRPVGVAVLQCVAGPVDAGPLAIPEAEHAIDLALRIGLDLLGSEHRGGGEVFVDRGQKLDAPVGEKLFGAPELHINAAERRTAVAGNETSGVEAIGTIAVALIEKDAYQRLCSGQKDASSCSGVSVEQGIAFEAVACRLDRLRQVRCPSRRKADCRPTATIKLSNLFRSEERRVGK